MKRIALALVLALALTVAFTPRASAAENLTVFIWSEYMDPDVIAEFEKRFDAKVRLDFYESNEEMVAKLQSGALGQYDIIVPSTYMMPSLLNLKLIQPLDHAKLPNIGNISESFTKMEVDPGNKYSLPYSWGLSGLAVRSAEPDKLSHSWKLIFDPEEEVGGFVMLDSARDAIGAALKYLGYSLNSTNPDEVSEAVKLLIATKKRKTFQGFDNGVSGLNKVMGGIVTVAQSFTGEVVKAGLEDSEVISVIPEEGCEVWTDLIAVAEKAPNPDLAHKFINFLLEPEVAARLSDFTGYATPNEKAKALLPKEILENPGLYPSEEVLKNAEYIRDLGPANRMYDEAWTIIKNQ